LDAEASKVAAVPDKVAPFEGMRTLVVGGSSLAAFVVAEPPPLVNTARNSLPMSELDTEVMVYVVDVAPEISLQVDPPSVEFCHCTVGDGLPLAAALKVTVPPAPTN
jgi:hypothetical protein